MTTYMIPVFNIQQQVTEALDTFPPLFITTDELLKDILFIHGAYLSHPDEPEAIVFDYLDALDRPSLHHPLWETARNGVYSGDTLYAELLFSLYDQLRSLFMQSVPTLASVPFLQKQPLTLVKHGLLIGDHL